MDCCRKTEQCIPTYIVRLIKYGRLLWAGHVFWLPEEYKAKTIFNREHGRVRRLRGRPCTLWLCAVEQDLTTLYVQSDWKRLAKERVQWRKKLYWFYKNFVGINMSVQTKLFQTDKNLSPVHCMIQHSNCSMIFTVIAYKWLYVSKLFTHLIVVFVGTSIPFPIRIKIEFQRTRKEVHCPLYHQYRLRMSVSEQTADYSSKCSVSMEFLFHRRRRSLRKTAEPFMPKRSGNNCCTHNKILTTSTTGMMIHMNQHYFSAPFATLIGKQFKWTEETDTICIEGGSNFRN